jgi:hypothetical protein
MAEEVHKQEDHIKQEQIQHRRGAQAGRSHKTRTDPTQKRCTSRKIT